MRFIRLRQGEGTTVFYALSAVNWNDRDVAAQAQACTPFPHIFDTMSAELLPNLFSPLNISSVVLKNRIMSTGHDTTMPTDGQVNDALIAYHEARAKVGAPMSFVER